MKRTSEASRKGEGSRDVDAYLAAVPIEARRALQNLRKTVREAAPDAEEGFSYGVPAFRLDGRPLVGYSASKNHCSYYPMSGSIVKAYARDLEPYETMKGTIHFSPAKPLPASLVRKLVKARIAEIRKQAK